LEDDLKEAIREENYEKANELKIEIEKIKNTKN
jgi:protein-arginine kinase activator protein McsA